MKLPNPPGRTTPGFAFSIVERALRECLAPRKFGPEERAEIVSFFGGQPECAYCGSRDVRRWDHLVPVAKDGETVIGNMVLACATCDDSKRDLPYEEWMNSETKSSLKVRGITEIPKRTQRLNAYIRHYGFVPSPQESKLLPEEHEALIRIRANPKSLRADVEQLIGAYQNRLGASKESTGRALK